MHACRGEGGLFASVGQCNGRSSVVSRLRLGACAVDNYVCFSVSTHQEEVLVSTAHILLSIYLMDYTLQIIGDKGVA